MNKKYLLIGLITLAVVTTGCSKIKIGNITIQRKSDLQNPTQNIVKDTPKEKPQNLNIEQTKSTETVIETNQTSTVGQTLIQSAEETSTTKQPSLTNQIVDCNTDINCLENRAQNCEKTKYTLVLPWEMSPGIVYKIYNIYEITGMSNNQCNFNYKSGQTKTEVADSSLSDYMALNGLSTLEETKKYIEESNQKSTESTMVVECHTAEGKNITTHVKNLLNGTASLQQNNNEMVYENNVYCTQINN